MRQFDNPPAGKKYVFVPYMTRNGRVIYASTYGHRAFRILVDA